MRKIMVFVCAVAAMLSANAAISNELVALKHSSPIAMEQLVAMDNTTLTVAAGEEIVAKDTVIGVVDKMNTAYAAGQGVQYQFALNGGDYDMYICLYTGGDDVTLGQEYTEDNMWEYYTYINNNVSKKGSRIATLSFTKTQNGKDFNISVNALDSLGTRFLVDYTYQLPEKQSVDTIIAEDLYMNTDYIDAYIQYYGYGLYSVEGGNNRIQLVVQTDDKGTIEGTFTVGTNLSGTIDSSKVYSGSIEVEEIEDDAYAVEGTVLCYNNVEYYINLIYIKPTKTRDVVLNAEGGNFLDMIDDYQAWQAQYYDDTIMVVITMKAEEQIEGEYTLADNYGRGYTYFTQINGKDTAWYLAEDVNFEVIANEEDSVYEIAGTMLGKNSEDSKDVPLLTFNLTIPMPKPINPYEYDEKTLKFNATFPAAGVTVTDSYWATSAGLIYVTAVNSNYRCMALSIYDYGYAEGVFTPGSYDIADTKEDGTVLSGYYDSKGINPSYAGILNSSAQITNVWYLVSGTATIEDGVITVSATNSEGKSINATITLPSLTPVENVNADEIKATKILRNGQLILKSNNREFNALGQEL